MNVIVQGKTMLEAAIRKAEKEYEGKVKYAIICGSKSYGMTTAHDFDCVVVLDCDNFHSAFYKKDGEDIFVYSHRAFMDALQFKLRQSVGLHSYLACYMAKKRAENCLIGDISELDYDFNKYRKEAILEAISRCDRERYKWIYHSYALLYILQNGNANFTEEQLQTMQECKALKLDKAQIGMLKLALEEQLLMDKSS